MTGRTENFKETVVPEGREKDVGEIRTVEITGSEDWVLVGKYT